MAIDSREKKTSLLGYGLPFRVSLPYPDGTLDQGDRQHLIGLYAGILASSADSGAPAFTWNAGARGRGYTSAARGRVSASLVRGRVHKATEPR